MKEFLSLFLFEIFQQKNNFFYEFVSELKIRKKKKKQANDVDAECARCVGVKSCPSNGFGRKKKTDDCENSFLALLYDRESCTFVIGTGLSPAINRMADYVQHSDSAYFFFFSFSQLDGLMDS